MNLLVTVETGDMTQVVASRAGNVGAMDTGGWGRVLPSLLLTTVFPFLLPSFLFRGLAILGPQGMWARGVWGLVLSHFGVLILRIPSRQSLGLGSSPRDRLEIPKWRRPGAWPR